MIVEWNAHMFSSDTDRYPFYDQAAYVPALERLDADPLATYVRRMDRLGIDRAVLVQPEPYGDDHRLVLDCLEREPERIKATCLFLPKDPDATRKLADLATNRRIVALRFHAHRGKEQYLDRFSDPNVRALWEMAGRLGLTVELHIGPNYASQVAEAISALPDVAVLVDHMAEPHMGTDQEYNDVLRLADYRNVTMKMSGLNHFSKQGEPFLDTRDIVRRVGDAFGPDRLAWSSGSPAIVDALLGDWPDSDRAKVKGGNLAKLAGF